MGARGAPKTGGRQKGSVNKSTIEKTVALQIDNIRRGDLPVDVLARLMKVAEGAAGRFQQRINGEGGDTTANWERFEAWFDRARQCARDLAPFTAPTYRAVAVVTAPSDMAAPAAQVIEHEPRDTEERERKASESYLRLVKG